MPIRNIPFTRVAPPPDITRPYLPIKVINPHTGLSLKTYGLVDTGADGLALPARIAQVLGHNFQNGTPVISSTGNGNCLGFAHTTKVEIHDLKIT
jgi:predicted aspartyl protease